MLISCQKNETLFLDILISDTSHWHFKSWVMELENKEQTDNVKGSGKI